MTLRCLTLTQPWCGLMAAGIKLVENRSRSVIKSDHIGQRLGLHASREIDGDVVLSLKDEYLIDVSKVPHALATSAILCVVTLAAIVHTRAELYNYYRGIGREDLAVSQRQWKIDPSIGYVLTDITRLPTPVACRGMLGFWTAPDEVARAVREELLSIGATR